MTEETTTTISTPRITLSFEQQTVLYDELVLAEKRYPGILARFQQAMHRGLVISDTYTLYPEDSTDERIKEPCACFYGWNPDSFSHYAAVLCSCQMNAEMGRDEGCYTFVESFLLQHNVYYGDTPSTDSRGGDALFILDTLIDSIPHRV